VLGCARWSLATVSDAVALACKCSQECQDPLLPLFLQAAAGVQRSGHGAHDGGSNRGLGRQMEENTLCLASVKR